MYLKKETSPTAAEKVPRAESFELDDGRLIRRVLRRDGSSTVTDMGKAPKGKATRSELHAIADLRYLRQKTLPRSKTGEPAVTIADLFCGIGALTLGAFEAARAVGRPAEVLLAADFDPAPLAVLQQTLSLDRSTVREVDLAAALGNRPGRRSKDEARFLGRKRRHLDILLAGPPCQGHSRLNNHTRHNDPRNDLYLKVARFVELEQPRLCVIENVDSIVHDLRRSASETAQRLEGLGYHVDEARVSLHDLGVPQRRRRHVLVATRDGESSIDIREVLEQYAVDDRDDRNLRWAIEDLAGRSDAQEFDAPGRLSEDNRKRIRWLHSNVGRFDLPNRLRPPCHRVPKIDQRGQEREHSYKSMYGKLDWEKPAQTITSGFGSMGQGRYVHPAEERTLTPHEAARLQFVPDFVRFDAVKGRGQWSRLIGNVAPMKLSYVFALEFLR